jgi:hypothetical protein
MSDDKQLHPIEHEGFLDLNDPRCVTEPSISGTATLYQEMPPELHEVMHKNNLRIRLDKVLVKRIFDQLPGMIARDGCISAPSGPGC